MTKESKSQPSSNIAGTVGRWLGVVVSIALLVWLFRAFDLAEVGRALQAANYLYLFPTLALLVLNFCLRALRWGTLFDIAKLPRWESLFVAMMIGYLSNNILPARAGELVRAYVLGQRDGIPKSAVIATVVVERVADLVVALLLLATVLLYYPLPIWLERAGVIVSLACLTLVIFLVSLNIWGAQILAWMMRVLGFLPIGFLDRIKALGGGFLAGVGGLRRGRAAFLFMIYTGLIWSLELLVVWMVAQAFYLPIAAGGIVFVMVAVGLGTMAPSSPGSIGTYEFFAANALTLIGVAGDSALSFALVLHAISFLGASFLGAACLAWSRRKFGFTISRM